MLNGQDQLCDIEPCLVLVEGDLAGDMKTEVPTRAVVQCEVEVVWGLKREVQVDDEWVAGLFQNVGLDDCVFQLFLQDQVFLFQCFERIEVASGDVLGQKHLAESTAAQG